MSALFAIIGQLDRTLDFMPEEGDSIVVKPSRSKTRVVVLPDRVKINNVQVKSNGDVRVKFSGKAWTNLVRINRSDLTVNVRNEGQNVHLRFKKKF